MPHAARRPLGLSPLASRDPERVGAYTLVGRLGAGRTGTVYAARGHDSQLFALRVFHPEFAEDPGFRARLREEVAAVRQVSGPFVSRFLTADPQARAPWLATELVPGPTLGRWVEDRGPLTGAALVALAAGTLDALRVLHERGVVHRDLKPGNVVLAPEGPKVLDPGIARALDETVLTRTGGLSGDSGWIAPERYRNGASTPGADVFAWGALMVLASTGREPFGTGKPQVVAGRVLWEEPDLEGVPADLLPLVGAALAKDPERRPSAAELLRALSEQGSADGSGSVAEGSAGAVALVGRGWRGFEELRSQGERRWRGTLVLAALACSLVLAGVVGALF
ncbi:serine/threonine-protein kinase [Nocardiopsis ganjiahuensis]|uniref:serine/threonine-protein kinase n=1 Tax=Nocardiopsis ganjiahuensis TaxID=239984 RepID=UPI001360B1BB|nr:serine/threonine-protein kinase [Nocardiopsis ganjiahuensis]